MGELFQTPDEMYSEYLLFFKCSNTITYEDRIINSKYEYLQWSARRNTKVYKLHYRHPLIGVKVISEDDYELIEIHYQFLKLKYG